MAVSITINLVNKALGGVDIEISLSVYLSKFMDLSDSYLLHGSWEIDTHFKSDNMDRKWMFWLLPNIIWKKNGKLTLGIKIACNQGVTMNMFKCDQSFYGEGNGGERGKLVFHAMDLLHKIHLMYDV